MGRDITGEHKNAVRRRVGKQGMIEPRRLSLQRLLSTQKAYPSLAHAKDTTANAYTRNRDASLKVLPAAVLDEISLHYFIGLD